MLFFSKKPEKPALTHDDTEKIKDFLEDSHEYPEINVDNYPENEKSDVADFFARPERKQSGSIALKPRKVEILDEMPDEDYKFPDEAEIIEKSVEPVPITAQRAVRREVSAPLFVKVDKYNDILDKLDQTKALLSGIKGVFPLIAEADAVKKDAVETLRLTLQKVEKNIVILDSAMLRPGEFQLDQKSPAEAKHVEDSLTQLQLHLGSLKSDLEKMKE